jgi:hypothetical protein
MEITHHASNCRWAVPTLFLGRFLWLSAEDYPWTCLRATTPRVLVTTDECATCPAWEPKPAEQATERSEERSTASANAGV